MKSKASRLDRYADQLAELDAEKKTLADIQAWLKAEGCAISITRLSGFLERLRSDRRQAAMLSQIASGARQHHEVQKSFEKNPAPELETLIKLHRVLIMQLSTQAVEDPELLKLTDQLTRTVMEFISGQTKHGLEQQKISLAERRVSLLEKKAAAFDAAKEVFTSTLSPEEQRQRLKEILR